MITEELLQLGPCGQRLEHMQIHLVAVKVRVVRVGTAKVEAERQPGHELDTVTHHAHAAHEKVLAFLESIKLTTPYRDLE